MEDFLAQIHRQIGEVAGQISIALAQRRVTNGRTTLARWSEQLKRAAALIDEKIKK